MFKELTRIKGTDITVKEAREKMLEAGEYDSSFINNLFEDYDENEKILEAFGGSFAQETKTETVLFFEEM